MIRPARQSGFTLVSTLFLLVVVAVLAAYMVRLSTAQQMSSALGIGMVRAHYAALSGLEWVQYRIGQAGACPAVGSHVSIDGFDVSLAACSSVSVTEGISSYPVYDIEIEATHGSWGQPDFSRRRLRVTLKG